jgi:hypothetical protein
MHFPDSLCQQMAKKVFYTRRYKLPTWGQPYIVWGVISVVTLAILFFTSVEKIDSQPATALATPLNGFAEGLFYELRDAEKGGEAEVTQAFARRLGRKHGYKVTDTRDGACRVIRITHGQAPQFGLMAALESRKGQDVFALLVFLDRILGKNPSAAIDARIVVLSTGCESAAATRQQLEAETQLPVMLDAGNNGEASYRALSFRNLKLRKYFEQLYLSVDKTLWANVMALASSGAQATALMIPVKAAWAAGPEAQTADNPLAHHPLVEKGVVVESIAPVAVYLADHVQLQNGGFGVICLIIWLLALIPWGNALSTFRERLDIGSALTSSVLYMLAFMVYLILVKLLLGTAKSDVVAALISLALFPAIFIPIRILQKSLLRAELNRAGLHLILQGLLTIALFVNPLVALLGFVLLLIFSGFGRAEALKKLLRLVVLSVVLALFFLATRHPLGSFNNFLTAFLPIFSFNNIFIILLAGLIGGNLVALLFVPRERV